MLFKIKSITKDVLIVLKLKVKQLNIKKIIGIYKVSKELNFENHLGNITM